VAVGLEHEGRHDIHDTRFAGWCSVLRGSVRERVYGVGATRSRDSKRAQPSRVDALQSERDLRAGSTLALADPYIQRSSATVRVRSVM